MNFRRVFTLLCSLLISGQVYAQIYKWTDENGKIQFGDRPPKSAETNEVILNKINVIDRNNNAGRGNRRNSAVVPYEQRDPGENGRTLPNGKRIARPRTEAEAAKYEALVRGQLNERMRQAREVAVPAKAKQIPIRKAASPDAAGSRALPCPVTLRSICRGRQLQQADYSRLDIFNVDFSNANLEGADFSGADIGSGTSFVKARLANADFSGATLNNVDFSDADLSNANFTNIECFGCTFDRANLTSARFSGDGFINISFRAANLKDVRLDRSNSIWTGVDFTGAINLDRAASGMESSTSQASGESSLLVSPRYTYNGCVLGVPNSDCSNKDLSGHRFLPINLEGGNFTNARLVGADLSKVRLMSARFDNALLDDATLPKLEPGSNNSVSFKNASLRGTKFTGRYIVGDFSGADLSNADLSGKDARTANFKGAIFNNTNIKGTQFTITSLAKAHINACKKCQQLVKNGNIDVAELKRSFTVERNKNTLSQKDRRDRAAVEAYLQRSFRLERQLAALLQGKAVIEHDELIDLLSTMLSSTDPETLWQALRVIERTDDSNYSISVAENTIFNSICSESAINTRVLPLLNYTQLPSGERQPPPRSHQPPAVKIRELAVNCLIKSAYEQNQNLQQALIVAYRIESNPKIKRYLLQSLVESQREISQPLLVEAVKSGDKEISVSAAYLLARWHQLPSDLLPALAGKFKGMGPVADGWVKLMGSYGAMAADFISELERTYQGNQAVYKQKFKRTLSDYDFERMLKDLKTKSRLINVGYGLTRYDRQTVLDSYLLDKKAAQTFGLEFADTVSHFQESKETISAINNNFMSEWVQTIKNWFSRFLNFLSGFTMTRDGIGKALYSEETRTIESLVTLYGLPKTQLQSIEAVSGIEYRPEGARRDQHMGYSGIDVFVLSSEQQANKLGRLLVNQKQPRRQVAQKGKLIYVVWSDPESMGQFRPIYSGINNSRIRHPELIDKNLAAVSG